MNNYICIKNNRNVSIGQEYVCHFNPGNGIFQIYLPGEHEIYLQAIPKDFNEHFVRKDIYRNKQIEMILQ